MNRIVTLAWLLVSGVALVSSGCAPGDLDEVSEEDEGLDDEGEADDAEDALSTSVFELPFPCNQVWSGQTRSNHSPQKSVDFNRSNDFGDTVVASAGGKVTRVENEGNTSYGRWVEIDHGGGYRTRYAHLSVQSVSIGQNVSRGQKIGEVGSTGGSTGPHLHFELRLNGTAIKPVFHGATALFYGTKNYTSHNCSAGGGGGGGGVSGTVNTAGPDLTIRASASPNSAAVGSVADGAHVTIKCQKHGVSVSGTYGTSTLWDFIGTGYVADAYVSTGSDGQVAPTCN
ncbi:MAG: peptidoglycan DD-metalloendopeptidase family protein [Polyangiaceae bacterium]|nr:peptidoglycan DD-metalloendopeptidase family protein [Polyangiaceae bacterium]